mmetsp:Transcript_22984/g.36140  ORF Transcript_22984/g.36140 Transcript_22984/m.36140 type:complete len:289 (-) Transcript_22984:1718-2584(-)
MFFRLDLSHWLHEENEAAIKDKLDDGARVWKLLDLTNVGRLDGRNCNLSLVHKRLSLSQVRLARPFLFSDARRVGLALGGDLGHLVALLLGLGGVLFQVLQHLVGLLGGDVELDLLVRQDNLHGLHVLRALDELLQAQRHALLLQLQLGQLLLVLVLEQLDEAQVRLGRLVHAAAHLGKVLLAHLGHHVVHQPHVHHEVVLGLLGALNGVVADEALGHGDQRLLRPGEEPVDGRPRDQARELSGADWEFRVQGRHAEHKVQVVTHAVGEELFEIVLSLLHAWSLLLEC